MKKILYLFIVALIFNSCDKDDVGGTATEAMAGEWYVSVDLVDENGDLFYSGVDFFGLSEHMLLNTYNTASNSSTEMYVDDKGNFWDYKVRVNCNLNSLTFSTNGAVANEAYEDCDVTIEDGKIMYGAATTPHGTPADSIVFYVSFSDDPYPDYYGYAKYKVSGYRYTGLASDD